MRIALLYNPRPHNRPLADAHGSVAQFVTEPRPSGSAQSPRFNDDDYEEYDGPETIDAIAAALTRYGSVHPVEANRDLPHRLAQTACDFVFNIAEGHGRRSREAVPAAVCELLGLPYTGSDPLTLAVTLDKYIARRIVSPDVPVAPAALCDNDESELDRLRYPVIVKPNDEGSSKGIRDNPLATTPAAALERCRWLRQRYHCPVLVEEFLPGAEVTAGLAGPAHSPRLLGLMQIAPAQDDPAFVYSLKVKRDYERRVRYHVPPQLPQSTLDEIERLAIVAYRLLDCRDIARIDFRLDAAGRPRFLEANPLPGLNPRHSDLVIMTRGRIPYDDLVRGMLRDAAARHRIPLP